MAKKIKFALKMKDGVEVRTLQELKDGFDLNAVMAYFLDGKLESWLSDRYYEDLADSIQELDKNDPELRRKLCRIFEVEYEDDAMSIEEIEERNRRISRLKEITDDESIIENVDSVAFSQEELADLLDEEIKTIYLCDNSFRIPTKVAEVIYINVNSKIKMNARLFENYKKNNITLIGFKETEDFCETPKDIQEVSSQLKLEMKLDYDLIHADETLELDDLITISNQRVKYYNCNIKANGYLENCIVAKNSKLYFENCRIEFVNDDEDYNFILSEHSDLEFVNTEIVGGTRFVYNNSYFWLMGFCEEKGISEEDLISIENKICFKNCKVKDIQYHFIDGSVDFLEISKSIFYASANNDDEAYISSGRKKLEISDSEFSGFDGVIVSDSQLTRISNTKFADCKNFIGYISGENKIEILDCEFKDCLHIIDTSMNAII